MQQQQKRSLGIDGTRVSGLDVRRENVTAVTAVANIVKSSLGPVGLDKMIVDEIGDVVVTNDGATILKRLDVEHPAGRMLVDLAQLQDQEVGDGTTSVVILAAELLKRAQELILQGIHATSIISGYKVALREALKHMNDNLSTPVSSLGVDVLLNVARTSMSSKILNTDADIFAQMVVDAIQSIKTINDYGDVVYPRKAVGILKQHGKHARDSTLIRGFALNAGRAAQGMPSCIDNPKIALVDFDLRAVKMRLGVTITITDPTKADDIKRREIDITKERVEKMIRAGANVIITTFGMEDAIMKYMVENNVLGIRRVRKEDLRRMAKVTGAQIVHTLSDLNNEEIFDPAWLGTADRIEEERFADDECTVIRGGKANVCASIILRGANTFVLEEMERAMNDALWAVARSLDAQSVVPGGGAVETALSVYLENFAHTICTREQLAIAQFAESLLVIPKTLALNAALDATDLLAKLRVEHATGGAGRKFWGLDLVEGTLRDNLAFGVLEPRPSKQKSFQFATEAAITILRIDDTIRLNPPQEDEDPRGRR